MTDIPEHRWNETATVTASQLYLESALREYVGGGCGSGRERMEVRT